MSRHSIMRWIVESAVYGLTSLRKLRKVRMVGEECVAMRKSTRQVAKGLREALSIARGEANPSRLTFAGN